ncbi:MAG: radical SAM protein [Bacilli bacterium]|nr:radical SAM protein [Bacilli bacterium]
MKFKKIYLEITNACNLNCPFCIKNKRKVEYLTFDNYKLIIDKIKNHTKEIYFHILGEPLLHPKIINFIEYANEEGLLVNVTTNGYLINNLKNNDNVHRLNISLHSYNVSYKIDLDTYLDNIFNTIENIRNKTFVSLRLWVGNKNTEYILKYINDKYNVDIDKLDNNTKIKVTSNLIIDTFHEFIWPDLNNNYYNKNGKCMGLIDHIGILSDGRVVPCCLDAEGIITLGNIYNEDLDNILNKEIVKDMIKGFKNGYKCQELCKHCSFIETTKK